MSNANVAFDTYVPRQFVSVGTDSKQKSAPRAATTWVEWASTQCVVLLGEPGSGKSTEFLHQIDQLRAKVFVC